MAKPLMLQPNIWLAFMLMLTQTLMPMPLPASALPHTGRPDEVVMVEAVQCPGASTNAGEHNANATATAMATPTVTPTATAKATAKAKSVMIKTSFDDSSIDSNESGVRLASDDLIFLTKSPYQQQQQKLQQQQKQQRQHYHQQPHRQHHKHHHQQTHVAHIEANKQHIDMFSSAADDDNNGENEHGYVHENDALAHAEADAKAEAEAEAAANVKPIDMSEFYAIIPVDEVKSMGANYYRNDPEVRRVYTFLTSRHFAEVRAHVLQLPEMKEFLRHLSDGGLNLLTFLQTIINMTRNPPDFSVSTEQMEQAATPTSATTKATAEVTVNNEIESRLIGTTSKPHEFHVATTITMVPTTKAQLNGLHGFVEKLLILMPQDVVLTAFFDKLESDEQFSKLIDSIGTPKFAKIVGKMQNSGPLRNFLYTLHNNGVYLAQVVDSLKAYFLLGTL